MYAYIKNKYNVHIVFILYSNKHFCCYWGGILVWVRDRFGGKGRFKGRLRSEGWINSVIVKAITEMNYRCNYKVFLYMYNVKNMYVHNKCIVPNN